MGDGLILRMQYEAGVAVAQLPVNRLKSTGFPDYLPGLDKGLAVMVNDAPAEVIGLQAEDYNMPLPWLALQSGQGGGGQPADGTYFFLLAIQDSTGNEIYVGPAILGYMADNAEQGTVVGSTQSVKFSWRKPVPRGGRLNVYACKKLPLYGNLKRIASIAAEELPSPTSCVLASFEGDYATFEPRSVTWTVTCKLPEPIAMGSEVKVDAPASLIVDELGNATAEATKFKAINNSAVGSNGFLATNENPTATSGTFKFKRVVHVSYSKGSDSKGNGSLTKPFKTVGHAMNQTASGPNVCFRFLRGDIWPADVWTRAYWGTDVNTPSLFESYWNPKYGEDPGIRPIMTAGDPYYAMPSKNLDMTASLFQNSTDSTRSTVGNGDRPYIYFRGISFRADPDYPSPQATWPAVTAEDFVILSDCEFQNIYMVGTYGAPQFNAPVGCMFHRTAVHSVHGSPLNTHADRGSGGTTLVLPDRFINPWAGYPSMGANLIVPGQEYIRLFNVSTRWKIDGWKITVSEGRNRETKTLTKYEGGGSKWGVDSPFTGSYSREGCSISLDPTKQQFKILAGKGAGKQTYTITAYDPAKRAAKVEPALPEVDFTSRLAFLPLGAWHTGGHLQGFFAAHCGDWLFSQCTFDKNGWNWHDDNAAHNDIYNHNIYLSGMCRDVVTHSCYLLRANSLGLQQRGGGVTAYNVFAENTHGSNMLGGGTVYKNLYTGQGLLNFSLSTAPSHLPISIYDSNIVLKSHNWTETRIANNNYSGICGINIYEIVYAHSHVAIRHNTYVDAGSMNLGNRLPVPGKIHVRYNLIVNRPKTGVDYKGTPLQSIVLSALIPNWQNNGIAVVAPNMANQLDIDLNAYLISAQPASFAFPDVSTRNFADWKAKGRDRNGIALTTNPKFADGYYTLDSWASDSGLGNSFESLWQDLRERQEGVWLPHHDAANCYQAFAAAYTPTLTSVPKINDSKTGFFGASDNRKPVDRKSAEAKTKSNTKS